MIKAKTTIEIKKENRIYECMFDNDAPLGEIYASITEMLNIVVTKINEVQKAHSQTDNSEKKEAPEEKKTDITEEQKVS